MCLSQFSTIQSLTFKLETEIIFIVLWSACDFVNKLPPLLAITSAQVLDLVRIKLLFPLMNLKLDSESQNL